MSRRVNRLHEARIVPASNTPVDNLSGEQILKKLIAAVIAAAFSMGAFAQTAVSAPKAA